MIDVSHGPVKVLVTSVEQSTTQRNDPYLKVSVSDGSSTLQCNLWNSTKDSFNAVGKVIVAEIECKGEKYYTLKPGYLITDEPVDEYVRCSPISTESIYDYFIETAKGFSNTELGTLVQAVLSSCKDKLLVWGAAKGVHHNFKGGLLYHEYRMLKSAEGVCKLYSVDAELVKAAVMLHDVGKVLELDTDVFGASEYTVDGKLFGHLVLGAEYVDKVARKLHAADKFNDASILKELKHCIYTHHGLCEWGAVTQPKTIEAFLVFMLDYADSHLMQYEDAVKDLSIGDFSAKVFGLGTEVYKAE